MCFSPLAKRGDREINRRKMKAQMLSGSYGMHFLCSACGNETLEHRVSHCPLYFVTQSSASATSATEDEAAHARQHDGRQFRPLYSDTGNDMLNQKLGFN